MCLPFVEICKRGISVAGRVTLSKHYDLYYNQSAPQSGGHLIRHLEMHIVGLWDGHQYLVY